MKQLLKMLTTLILSAGLSGPALAQSLPRSANGGPEGGSRGPGAVPVPRHPYAGAWEGTMTMDGGAASPMTMHFKVADAARQSYSGDTTIDGRASAAHLNISAAAENPATTGSPVARRSPGNKATNSGGPSAGTPEMDTLANDDHALLLFHTPSQSMLLCDEGHRCIALATLTWEEKGADGKHYSYAASLVSKDAISGTVTVTDGSKSRTGKFTLTRR